MHLGQLGEYYEWADKRMIELLKPVSDEIFTKVPETGRSLREIVEHMIVYYELVNKRSKYKEITERVKTLGKSELLALWEDSINLLPGNLEKRKFDDTVDFNVDKDTTITIPNFIEVFAYTDHATYHRGQLITTYKFLTKTQKAIATDFYDFLVEKMKK